MLLCPLPIRNQSHSCLVLSSLVKFWINFIVTGPGSLITILTVLPWWWERNDINANALSSTFCSTVGSNVLNCTTLLSKCFMNTTLLNSLRIKSLELLLHLCWVQTSFTDMMMQLPWSNVTLFLKALFQHVQLTHSHFFPPIYIK